MEEGTFTLVDEGIFCPVNIKQDRNDANQTASNDSDSEDDSDDESDEQINEESEKNCHRKVVRRKLEEGIETTKIDSYSNHKNKNKTKICLEKECSNTDEDDDEARMHNGFEFCTTIEDNVEIKKEIPSDIEKESDDSDDDIPLASLDKQKNTKQEKLPCDEFGSDSELNKLKIKIKKTDIPKVLQKEFCSKCNKFFKNKKKYRSHIRKIHGKLFKCKICTKSYDQKADLEDHYNYHTGNRPYCCYLCDNETFKTKFALKRHMDKLHSGRPTTEKKEFPCHVCGKILYTANSLEEHLRLHTGEKPIECKQCDKTFSRMNDLRQHQNIHEELWKCKFCQKCFTTPFKLKEHTRMHTGELPYECDKCDRKFARVADFRYHFGTHLGIKPYICEECGMRFTTSSSVTRHRLNMHQTGPKLYDCPQCPKKFHTTARLNTHIKNHENNKKFRCELCPAARNSLAELNKHVLIHGGEFRCDTCHRGFQSAERLAAHTLRHDIAGKPYACFVCSIGYRSSQSLNKHLSTVHRNEDIPKIAPQHLCTICGQVFELKDKLNRHLKESHIVIVVGEIHSLEEVENNKVDINVDSKMIVIEVPAMQENQKNDKVVPVVDCNVVVNEIPQISESVVAPIEDSDVQKTVDSNLEPSKVPPIVIETEPEKETAVITEKLEPKIVSNILNIPSVGQSTEKVDNSSVKDLSSSNISSELKPRPNSPIKMSYNKTFEQQPFLYDEALVQQNNRLLHTNYRPVYDNYQIPASNHVNNPWYASKPNEIIPAHRQPNPRTFFETRQRYELRMPRFNSFQINQPANYPNQRLQYPNQTQIPPRNRDDRKYYYEADQRLIPDDRRKYNQNPSETLTDLSSRQVREYSNHMLPGREYIQSPLGVCDLSNSNSQSPHYPHHSFSSPHHFFQNFRDLQHRMLGVQDYAHARHASLAGMDMTNQRLNPSSPLSPYNQTSPHLLENVSPMSRNSYEDVSNQHVPNHPYQGNHVQGRDGAVSNGDSTGEDKNNAEQMNNGGGPYEMRVAAN